MPDDSTSGTPRTRRFSPTARTHPRRRSIWSRIAWAVPLFVIQAFYFFGLLAEGGYNDYTRAYSLSEAIVMTSKVPFSHAFSTKLFIFIPCSLTITILAGLVLSRPMPRWLVVVIGLARLLLGVGIIMILMGPLAPVGSAIIGPLITWEMFHGTSGETYAEWGPVAAAAGWWIWYQIALFIRDLWRDRAKDACVQCDYPLTGLPPTQPCPECGTARVR